MGGDFAPCYIDDAGSGCPSYIVGIAVSTLSPEALLTNKSLTFLDLTNNSIGNDGASELAKVLRRNQTITEMKLWGNPIGKSGAEALSQALKCNGSYDFNEA